MDYCFVNNETGEIIELLKSKKYIFDEAGNEREINLLTNLLEFDKKNKIIEIFFSLDKVFIRRLGKTEVHLNNHNIGLDEEISLNDKDIVEFNSTKLLFKQENNYEINYNKELEQNNNINKFEYQELEINNNYYKISTQNKIKQVIVEYEMKSIQNFKMEIMRNNEIYSILNSNSITVGTKLRVFYSLDEMISLIDYVRSNEFLDYKSLIIIYNIIMKIENLSEYLMTYQDIDMKIGNIYINKTTLDIKFIFKNKLETRDNIYSNILELVRKINDLRPDNYLNQQKSKISQLLTEENLSLNKISKILIEEERQNKMEDNLVNKRHETEEKIPNDSFRDEVEKENDNTPIIIVKNRKVEEITKTLNMSNKKLLMSQLLVLLVLGATYFSNYLNTFDFIAFFILMGALNMGILKYFKVF